MHIIIIIIIIIIFYTPVLSSQGEKKLCYAKKNVKLEWSLLLLLLQKLSWSRIALKRWIRTEILWNKKLISLSSPDWAESLRPRFVRNTQPDALIGPIIIIIIIIIIILFITLEDSPWHIQLQRRKKTSK